MRGQVFTLGAESALCHGSRLPASSPVARMTTVAPRPRRAPRRRVRRRARRRVLRPVLLPLSPPRLRLKGHWPRQVAQHVAPNADLRHGTGWQIMGRLPDEVCPPSRLLYAAAPRLQPSARCRWCRQSMAYGCCSLRGAAPWDGVAVARALRCCCAVTPAAHRRLAHLRPAMPTMRHPCH
jgi:hypothetical protein